MNTDDVDAEWSNDPMCSAYFTKPIKDVDPYKAKCDLRMQGGATSPVTCCKYCHEYKSSDSGADKQCRSFVYLAGTCFLKNCKVSVNDNRKSNLASLPGAWSAATL